MFPVITPIKSRFFKLIVLVALIAISQISHAQFEKDSLWTVWNNSHLPDSTRFDAIKKLNWNHYLFTDQDSGLILAKMQHDLATEVGNDDRASNAIRLMGIAYYYKGAFDEAISHYNKALKMDSVQNDLRGMASSMLNLGLVYSDQGDFKNSIAWYLKGLQINEDLNDSLAMAGTLGNLGGMYFNQGNLEDATVYFRKSYDVYEALNDSGGKAMCLNNIGLMLQGQKKYDEAIEHHLRSLRIREQTGFKMGMTNSYDNLGSIYLELGEYTKALNYYRKSLDMSKEIGSTEGMIGAQGGLANIFFKQGNMKLARQHAELALQLTDSAEVGVIVKKEVSELLYRIYKSLDQPVNALRMYEQFVVFSDSLRNEESQQQVMRQHFQFETEKKEKEIALLNSESKRKEAQRNLFIGLTVAFMLLLGAGGYFIVRIRKQNKVIEVALEEKNVLLKEIHHRVKNNLQMISSLLGLQSRYTSDETASKALKESQGRVTSVSLIHQRLYSEDNLKGVYMPEYVQELTEELLYSANADMQVSLDVDELSLDIDTVIPLGLILNELITNAIKYGRKDIENDKLSVVLTEDGDELLLKVTDNGNGFPENFNPQATSSYGMKLINSLSGKLRAEHSFSNKVEGGAEVILLIRKYKHAV